MSSATLERNKSGRGPARHRSTPASTSPAGPARRRRGRLLPFLVWSLACAAGGIYFDRAWLPRTRIWLGEQVQTLSGYGQEQTVLGYLEAAGLAAADQRRAEADVEAVYARRQAGGLSEAEIQELARAEAPFVHAASSGTRPAPAEVEASLQRFAHLAGR